jgi:xylulokinase
MPYFMGIDLGTSSVKVIIIDEMNTLCGQGAQEYPILIPQPGHAEQSPQGWWAATVTAARQAIQQANITMLDAIGLCGQMHGFAMLDKAGEALGNAIIWPDQRSVHEVDEITALFGAPALANTVGTAPASGFMAPTLRWLSKHRPARLAQVDKVLTPKDYVRYRLCGEIQIDFSDASATALFDVYQHRWADAIISRLRLPDHIFPPLVRSDQQVGTLTRAAAEALGLPIGVPVAAGSADQPAQAVGNGLLDPGRGSITIGTGGQVFVPLTTVRVDPQLRLHTFCHAPDDRWYLLGASLAAGLSLRWLRDLLGLTNAPDAYELLSGAAGASSLAPKGCTSCHIWWASAPR